ncbi:12322_t:CDS:10, partial [Entrophospora sp. SA101]
MDSLPVKNFGIITQINEEIHQLDTDKDNLNDQNNNDQEELVDGDRRATTSRFSKVFDPNFWLTAYEQSNNNSSGVGALTTTNNTSQKRQTIIDYDSVLTGPDSIRFSKIIDLSLISDEIKDEDLDLTFIKFLDEMNMHKEPRNKLLQLPNEYKRALIVQSRQAKNQNQRQNSENVSRKNDNNNDTQNQRQEQEENSNDVVIKEMVDSKSEHSLASLTLDTANKSQEDLTKSSLPSLSNSTGFLRTPTYYIEKITQKNISSKSLSEALQSLRITVSSESLSWIRVFLNGKGLEALENILESYTVDIKKSHTRNSDHDARVQSECIRILRVLLNTEPGYDKVLKSRTLISSIVFCINTRNNKLRSQVADILAALCVMSLDGHHLVLSAFSDFKQINDEKFRFQYLIETLKGTNEIEEDSVSMEYKAACLSLINAIVNSPEEVEERMLLRDEFSRRGLNEAFMNIKRSDPPENLLTQIYLYEEEYQDDFDELYLKVHDIVRDSNDSYSILLGLLKQVEFDDSLYFRVLETLKNLLRIICKDLEINSQNEMWTIIELFVDRIGSLKNIQDEWQYSFNEFLSSIQIIVGKFSVVSGHISDEQIDNMKMKLNSLENNTTLETTNKNYPLKNQHFSESDKLAIINNDQTNQFINSSEPTISNILKTKHTLSKSTSTTSLEKLFHLKKFDKDIINNNDDNKKQTLTKSTSTSSLNAMVFNESTSTSSLSNRSIENNINNSLVPITINNLSTSLPKTTN